MTYLLPVKGSCMYLYNIFDYRGSSITAILHRCYGLPLYAYSLCTV